MTTLEQQRTVTLRKHPETLAWLTILVSFIIFVVIAVTVPLAIRYAVQQMMVEQPARLASTTGMLRLFEGGGGEPIALTGARDSISEGSRIVAADESAQGALEFVSVAENGDAMGSVQLYAGTDLEIVHLRRPRFERSRQPYEVYLRINHGNARIFTNAGDSRPLHVLIETPHATAQLEPGSYSLSISDSRTDLTTRSGTADLRRSDSSHLIVTDAQRAWATADAIAEAPLSAGENLLINGDFARSVFEHWQAYPEASEDTRPGSVRIGERDGRRAANFVRGVDGDDAMRWNAVSLMQPIGRDLNVYDSLTLQFDVMILLQSLSGAGTLGTEYPLRVEINYTTKSGQQLSWGHGFYSRGLDEDGDPFNDTWVLDRDDSTKIAPIQWETYTSPNLIELWTEEGNPPARIDSIRFYANGHNYHSMLSEVYLQAE